MSKGHLQRVAALAVGVPAQSEHHPPTGVLQGPDIRQIWSVDAVGEAQLGVVQRIFEEDDRVDHGVVAHDPLDGGAQGLAGEEGVAQGMEVGGTPRFGGLQAKTGVIDQPSGLAPGSAGVLHPKAGPRVIEQGGVEPGLAKYPLGIDAVPFDQAVEDAGAGGEEGGNHGLIVDGGENPRKSGGQRFLALQCGADVLAPSRIAWQAHGDP